MAFSKLNKIFLSFSFYWLTIGLNIFSKYNKIMNVFQIADYKTAIIYDATSIYFEPGHIPKFLEYYFAFENNSPHPSHRRERPSLRLMAQRMAWFEVMTVFPVSASKSSIISRVRRFVPLIMMASQSG